MSGITDWLLCLTIAWGVIWKVLTLWQVTHHH